MSGGRLYEIQPDDREPIEVTFFSEWFSDDLDDDASESAKLKAFDNATPLDKAIRLEEIIRVWEKSLGGSVIDLSGFDDLFNMISKVGFDNVINLIVYRVLTLGFDVYVGSDNTFIEIYGATDWE